MKTLITIVFLLFCSNAHAGYYIFHTGEEITGKNICGRVCRIRPDSLSVDEQTYNSANKSTHKVVNNVVVLKSQSEIDADIQARADVQAQALLDRIEALDLTTKELIDALIDLNVIKEKDLKDKVKLKKGITP